MIEIAVYDELSFVHYFRKLKVDFGGACADIEKMHESGFMSEELYSELKSYISFTEMLQFNNLKMKLLKAKNDAELSVVACYCASLFNSGRISDSLYRKFLLACDEQKGYISHQTVLGRV